MGTIVGVHTRYRVPLLAVSAALGVSLTLTACGGPTPSAGPTDTASPGSSVSGSPTTTPTPTPSKATVKPVNNLNAITVSGAAGKAPTVKIKAPYAIDQTRSTVLRAGSGPVVQSAGYVDVHYVGFNGRTGKEFDNSFTSGQTVAFPLDQVVAGFKKGLQGKKVGDRVLIAMPGADGYDSQGGNPSASIEVGDTLVFVADIVSTQLPGPSGTTVAPKAGLPTVTVEGGKPTITIPKTAAPTAMVAQPLINGDQRRTLAAADSLVARYRSASWKTGQQLEDRFAEADTGTLSATIPCWQKGLKGKAVGSRVLLVCPPADGYPEGSNNPPLEKGDTIVYVVDVLFASTQPLG